MALNFGKPEAVDEVYGHAVANLLDYFGHR